MAILEIEESEKKRAKRALEFVNAQRRRQTVNPERLVVGILGGICIRLAGYLFVILWMSL